MRHVKIERLIIKLGLVERFQCFARQSLREKGACVPVFFKPGDSHFVLFCRVVSVSIVAFTEISRRPSARMSCDIDFKSPVMWVFARRIPCSPMRLSAMYGVITWCLKEVDKRGRPIGVAASFNATDAVIIPFGKCQLVVFEVGRLVLFQCPVGHSVACSIASRHQTAPTWRADRTCISLTEHHASRCQSLHIGRFVAVIIHRALGPERQRSVLPAHVVYHEKNDVRTIVNAILCPGRRCHCQEHGWQGNREVAHRYRLKCFHCMSEFGFITLFLNLVWTILSHDITKITFYLDRCNRKTRLLNDFVRIMNENGDCSTLFVNQIQTGFAFASKIDYLCRRESANALSLFSCLVAKRNAICVKS